MNILKKKRKGNLLWTIDQQGQLHFPMRSKIAGGTAGADTAWEHPVALFIVLLLCAALDFIMFKQLFAAILYDSVWIQRFSILGLLICFDLAPIYLGLFLKKRKQGYRVENWILFGLAAAFFAAFIGNVFLRISMRDVVLPDLTQTSTSVMGEVQADTAAGSDRAMAYALFAAFLPFGTSLVSFGISYLTANPLGKHLRRLRREEVEAQEALDQIDATIAEYDASADHLILLQQEEDERYRATMAAIGEQTLHYCDYVRERIKEHLGDPAALNELSKPRREELTMLMEHLEHAQEELPAPIARIAGQERSA